jgi:penicillin V acylase-like amidase (Ntn superfamily)
MFRLDMKKWAFSIIFILFGLSSFAEEPGNCSTFMLKTDSVLLVGHNLDESPELHIPGLVCINKRNEYREGITWYELIADPPDYEKTLIPFEEKPEPKISWTSKYGSVTFNSEGLDFPDGGMNEKGLSVFEMSMVGTKHKIDESHPTLFICLWVQYQLDNYATVNEVIQNAENINQQGWAWHYFVTDKTGDCAIIEYIDGRVVVYKDENVRFPLLCNLQYGKELDQLKRYQGFGGDAEIRTSSLRRAPRFVRGAKLLKEFDPALQTSTEKYALQLLDEIKVNGWNKWGILADVTNMKFTFYTNRNRKLRYFDFKDFDFADGKPAQILDIHSDLSDDVASNFVDYSYERNLELAMERAKYLFMERFKGLIDNGVTAQVYAKRFADYSERMRNQNKK